MAAERQPVPLPQLVVAGDQPLIGVIERRGDEEVTRYFAEADADVADAGASDDAAAAALAVIGAWSDLEWDDMADALDRIRHESQPTPPVEL